MKDHELWNKLEESARDIKIPQALEPEQVKKQLKSRQRTKKKWYKLAVTAACLCLCFGAGSIAYTRSSSNYPNDIYQEKAVDQKRDQQAAFGSSAQDTDTKEDSKNGENAAEKAVSEPPLKKIGKMYTLASDYGDVYDVLYKRANAVMNEAKRSEYIFNDKSTGTLDKQKLDQEDSAVSEASLASADTADYSTTNLQVEGVDESDIVKTDGRYIYVISEDQVQILDVQKKVPRVVGTIVPDIEEDIDQICEMYVADHMLTLILQLEKTSIQEETDNDNDNRKADSDSEDMDDAAENGSMKKMATADILYSIDTAAVTKVLTYDITNPEKAALQSTVTQDGWYKTSRKIDSRLYLFTTQSLYPAAGMTRKKATADGQESRWIPCVNEKAISPDCIYLPKEGNQGLIMASIDLADHSKVLDTKLLVNNDSELYVSQNSVYLYYTDYFKEGERTRVARFGLDADGKIRAKAAATVKGSVQDTFAVHERDNYLQILTSLTSSEPWENRVYVLDENMKVTGKLTGLAKGEIIYSARFVGTIGYFVTYRNTDPLFTVDFSNPEAPKVIGELKVTGFSEYLHFWSDKRLLGIGYETNPEDGRRTGVKLSMFDISNPSKVTEKARLVLEDADESAGMYNYKCVLVNRGKNMIALTTENYDQGCQLDYRVFSYKNGKFISRLKHTLSKKYSYRNSGDSWRSLYVEDILYVVNANKAIAFDIKDGYKKVGKVKYAK